MTSNEEIEYDDVRAYVAYGTSGSSSFSERISFNGGVGIAVSLFFGKRHLRSDDPTKYAPTPWLRFHYMHGWLQSLVLDSLNSYQTQIPNAQRNVYRPKIYRSSHAFGDADLRPERISR